MQAVHRVHLWIIGVVVIRLRVLACRPLVYQLGGEGHADKVKAVVGYALYRVGHNAVPKSIESVRTRVVAEPVHARYPDLFTVFIVYLVAVGVQPIVALLGFRRAFQQLVDVNAFARICVLRIIVIIVVRFRNAAFFYGAVFAVELSRFDVQRALCANVAAQLYSAARSDLLIIVGGGDGEGVALAFVCAVPAVAAVKSLYLKGQLPVGKRLAAVFERHLHARHGNAAVLPCIAAVVIKYITFGGFIVFSIFLSLRVLRFAFLSLALVLRLFLRAFVGRGVLSFAHGRLGGAAFGGAFGLIPTRSQHRNGYHQRDYHRRHSRKRRDYLL